MGKRSDFKRVERDFYPTPMEAVLPLLPHLKPTTLFVEPCAGDGALMDHLEAHGHLCTDAFDIEPQREGIRQVDALSDWNHAIGNVIITNPPWDRKILHPMIDNFRVKMPTWLLFDADWMHTRQSAPFMPYCRKIVSVGRVKWIPDSKMTGKDNCAWYYFDCTEGETVFSPRA
jgi:hypothetical protein